MRCHDVTELVHELVREELDPSTAAAIHDHLAHCSSCRAEHEGAAALAAAVSTLPPSIEPPRDLWPEVRRSLEH